MSNGLSVIVTVRGDEPKLIDTIANVRNNAGVAHEVIVVYDGQEAQTDIDADQVLGHRAARGIGPSRHKGIEAAKYPVVLLIDAHMGFQPDFGKVILKHFKDKKNQNDVTCGRCRPAMLDLSPDSATGGYTGARFGLKSNEPGGEFWCLSGKWADQKVNAEIGCVYGACYAFAKSWYKKIGEPLNLLRGWWGDEEYLSISSWLAGGRCYLLDYWVSHLFRDKPSFEYQRDDWMYPALNRKRLIDLYPCDAALKEDLQAWQSASIHSGDADFRAMCEADKQKPVVVEALKLWSTWAKNVPQFAEKWIDDVVRPLAERIQMRAEARPWKREEVAEPIQAAQVPLIQQRAYITCPNCGRRNTFRVDRTAKRHGQEVRYGKCKEHHCQNRGVMIDRAGEQVMHWGRNADLF